MDVTCFWMAALRGRNQGRRTSAMRDVRASLFVFGIITAVVVPGALSQEGLIPSGISAEVSGLRDESVMLPCQLTPEVCGSIHSIKWYRGERRVYIFSEIASLSRAEDDLSERGKLHLLNNNSLAQLEINPLMTADADLYKCEVTYLEVRENCALVQTVRLNTYAKPSYVKIELSGTETANASLIGPFDEGKVITLICISAGGKPVAQLEWYNSSSPLQGQYRNLTEDDGTGVASSHLTLTLTRGDLGAKLECRGSSPVLATPMKAWVELDVYVRPAHWEVTGYEGPVLQGTLVTLLCRVKGARPAANITWYNGTRILSPQPSTNLAVQNDFTMESEIIEADGTYETQSRLIFTATRFDNGIILACQASNPVMENIGEIPYRTPTKIVVNYLPVVTVSPGNVTVNETSDIFLSCEVDANPPELISVRWYRDGELVEVSSDPNHFEGGTVQEPSLIIRNSSRKDLGVYSCVVQNQIGATSSQTVSNVNVLYKPRVKLTMDPALPVREQDGRNVTLFCEVESGNPSTLEAVRWYLDGDLLKELPECFNGSSNGGGISNMSDLCDDIDPSKLLLENVERSFQGNYTCRGRNEAGWGDSSPNTELHVHYPPGPARLEFDPLIVVKGQALNMRCIVDEEGRPPAQTYRWMRGSHVQTDIHTFNFTISQVSLETRANFSCQALNQAGQGPPASITMEVFAQPTFIERLQPYRGALTTAKDVSISCQVECFPMCDIIWLKDGLPLGDTEFYTIKKTSLPPDSTKSDFESIVSTLIWNLTAWPGGQLDRLHDNANYTCQSTSNSVGSGVSSTTSFRVEYPPELISVSSAVVNVVENEIPDRITCSAKAFPEASYIWKYGDQVVSSEAVLFLGSPFQRSQAGEYECIALNQHGNVSTKAVINVQYAPECTITQKESDDALMLVCEVEANPSVVDFQWMLDNTTYDANIMNKGRTSTITLIASPEYFGKYKCFANNSIGMSNPCERIISAGSWIRKLSDDKVIIIAAIVGAAIVLFLIACIIIILVCRRKRMNEKYHNSRPEERQNPEGKQDLTVTISGGGGGLPNNHNNNNNNTSSQNNNNGTNSLDGRGLAGGESGQVSNGELSMSGGESQSAKWPVKPGVHLHVNGLHSLGKSVKPVNGFSYGSKSSTNLTEGSNSPGSKDTLKERNGSGGNGEHSSNHRKRKKPMKDPSPAHRKGDLSEDDKAFYENLPFHGLQSPQSKGKDESARATKSEVRPPSELSQTGSSGYGSTRSQKQEAAAALLLAAGTTDTVLRKKEAPKAPKDNNCERESGAVIRSVATKCSKNESPEKSLRGQGEGGGGSLKPVNVVKPSTEEGSEMIIGENQQQPMTSTPVGRNVFSRESNGGMTGEEGNGFNMKTNCHSLGRRLGSKIPSPILPGSGGDRREESVSLNPGEDAKGKPPLAGTIVPTPVRNGNVSGIKLATVRPQRISSMGSFRPFRVPEAPKILFRSVRGTFGKSEKGVGGGAGGREERNCNLNGVENIFSGCSSSWETTLKRGKKNENLCDAPEIAGEGGALRARTLERHSKFGDTRIHVGQEFVQSSNPLSSLPIILDEKTVRRNPGSKQNNSMNGSRHPGNELRSLDLHHVGGSGNSELQYNQSVETNSKSCSLLNQESGNGGQRPGSSLGNAPLAAPRTQIVTKSRGHTYQNIPFTKKTPKHEI